MQTPFKTSSGNTATADQGYSILFFGLVQWPLLKLFVLERVQMELHHNRAKNLLDRECLSSTVSREMFLAFSVRRTARLDCLRQAQAPSLSRGARRSLHKQQGPDAVGGWQENCSEQNVSWRSTQFIYSEDLTVVVLGVGGMLIVW